MSPTVTLFILRVTIMANVFNVADYILKNVKEPMTTMKLQKLCYYSYVWHMVYSDEVLFNETYQAWANGPVSNALFQVHKGFFQASSTVKDRISTRVDIEHPLTDGQIESVDTVIENYGHLSGAELSDLTHQEAPWINAREQFYETQNDVMSHEAIHSYYSELSHEGGVLICGNKED
jgi:uncharacterized phage-associated protein